MHSKNNLNRTMMILFLLIVTAHEIGVAQSPVSFFPHRVGNLWQYRFYAGGALAWTERLDSMFIDTSGIEFVRFKRLYHDINPYTITWWYVIKDSSLVYTDAIPRPPQDSVTPLLYKLNARLGEVWVAEFSTFQILKVAKVAIIDTVSVFGHRAVRKEIWYGYPGLTDTSWWDTRTIASDFGLLYAYLEPMGPLGLAGAIIDSVWYGWIVNVPGPVEVPHEFSLRANFPNPFNPSTTIQFAVPHRARVELTVYDVLGRYVQSLVDRVFAAGIYSASWDASLHSSGVYFYRLKADGRTITKKMILQK
jgi:hypothetical protein